MRGGHWLRLTDWVQQLAPRRVATLEAIYLTPAAGQPMQRVTSATLGDRGLVGDRYAVAAGHWQGPDGCAVTLIRAEDLERIERRAGVAVLGGEHRRNLVVRGLPRGALESGTLVIGPVVLQVVGARPPCGYLERLTQPGMVRALRGRGGACARVRTPGPMGVGDIVRWEAVGSGTSAGDGGTN